MKKISYILLLLTAFAFQSFSQENDIDPNGYNVFYHENGEKSSEGYMVDGKPDGYWKTYNEEGILISEGNRENHKLDSLWKFYDDEGKLAMEINYENGKKNGIRRIYREDEIIEENFVDNVKQGLTTYFYSDGTVKKTVNFKNGLEEGIAREYGKDGRIITIINYNKGFITSREKINRYDQQDKKHGKWKYFYDEEYVLKMEGNYKHGLKHGYFKEYDLEGNLLSAVKYENGEQQEDVAELTKLDVKKDYYPDGQVRIVATYKDGVPEGVRREFNEEGEIEKAYIFKNGIVIGEGILTTQGEKDGFWKEYYDDGKLKAEGRYEKDRRIGEWKFYHKNGKLEQIGTYNDDGRYDGRWKWYYNDGDLLREESYYNGLADGLMTEYDEDGQIVAEGEYIEGLENGYWIYDYGDIRMEGEYVDGLRNGEWKHYYSNGQLSFEGEYIDDNPNGRHVYYWKNGNIKDEQYYVMGRKDGEWKKYNSDGTLFMVISYENGKEKKYDGIKINMED